MPISKPRYRRVAARDRFDERDNVQARNTYEPGSEVYRSFYATHPEWEGVDQAIRDLPGLGRVGEPLDQLLLAQEMEALLRLSGEDVVDGPVAGVPVPLEPGRASLKIRAFARHLGADQVKIGPLDPANVYSHIGKTWGDPARPWGKPIALSHPFAISLAIGLNPEMIRTGPVLSETIEVMRVYGRLALAATTLAAYIRSLGYGARAHVMPNYQVLTVPVAIDAGMGELGRHGLMITKELGSCLKLATVTTELPMDMDAPVDIGVEEFCRDCRICAQSCPGGAIPHGEPKCVRGVEKWAINPEACFKVWNETGTDCGVCMASCPWTKPRTRLHRLAAEIASRKWRAGWWMSRVERLVYGPFRPKAMPGWFEKEPGVWRKYRRLG
ncbi:MAG: putative reductive dehalogenase [Holophagaceae bacterium]|nr:putative reductive dehalogenase [Holophagaceae bacterium]